MRIITFLSSRNMRRKVIAAECREENNQRYGRSACVPACESLCADLREDHAPRTMIRSGAPCQGFVGQCWQAAKVLLSGLGRGEWSGVQRVERTVIRQTGP